jgi:amino acid transporter
MARSTYAAYRRNLLLLMAVYTVLLLLLWPLAKHTTGLVPKTAYTLVPVVPMIGALWLIARRIMDSDELQQRLHLIALSAATGVISAVSLAAGFLCATGVLTLDGHVLIWIMPGLALVYSGTRWFVGRRYGGGFGCE